MIGILIGKINSIQPPFLILDVNGVGYEVEMPMSHLANLTAIGSQISVYTHLVIREDAHLLFGFINKLERDCFRQLIKVSGIGPKIALALLSTLTSQEVQLAIDKQDINTLCRTPGIGKKMAERMLLELKGKLFNTFEISSSNGLFITNENQQKHLIRQDIANALIGLGYNTKEINNVLKNLPEELTDLSYGIKEALKLLSNH